MFCTRCGAEVVGSAAFCAACGAATGQGVDPAGALKRPGLITLLAVLQFIAAAIWLPIGVFLLVTAGASDPAGQGIGSTKSGYVIALESAGAAAGPNDCNNVATEQDFCASATPQQFQTTGMRAFSTSANGEIYVGFSGTPPSREETLTRTGTPLR